MPRISRLASVAPRAHWLTVPFSLTHVAAPPSTATGIRTRRIRLLAVMVSFDPLRDPTRLRESAMGNLVADAMRSRYARVDAALTSSGSLRANLLCALPSSGEPPCAITLAEAYAVLPFGNTAVIEMLTGAQLQQALQSGFSPMCDPAVATGRFPQVSGLKVTHTCNGTTAVVTGMWLAPGPPRGGLFPIGASTPVRIVTDSFLFSGGKLRGARTRHKRPVTFARRAPGDGRLYRRPFVGGDSRGGSHRRAVTPQVACRASIRSWEALARWPPFKPAPAVPVDELRIQKQRHNHRQRQRKRSADSGPTFTDLAGIQA
jgi:hypothetical protein